MQFLVADNVGLMSATPSFSLEVVAMGDAGFRCDAPPLLPRSCIRECRRPQPLIRLVAENANSRGHQRERRKNSQKFLTQDELSED